MYSQLLEFQKTRDRPLACLRPTCFASKCAVVPNNQCRICPSNIIGSSGDFFAITLNPTCTRSVLPLWLAGLNIKRSRRRPRSRSAPADICWVEDMQQVLSIRPDLLIYATSLISRTGSFDVHDETNSETISRFCLLLRSCAGARWISRGNHRLWILLPSCRVLKPSFHRLSVDPM